MKESYLKQYSEEAAKDLLASLKQAELEELENEEADVTVVMTTEDPDRDGDVIDFDGWDFENFQKNPVILWGHDFHSMPIGRAMKITKDTENRRILVDVKFASTQKAQDVKTLVDEGVVNAVSPGFIVREFDRNGPQDGMKMTKQELLELSFVPIPANPNALAQKKMLKMKDFMDKYSDKRAVPAHDAQKAPMNRKWDAKAAVNRLREWASSDGSGKKSTIDFEQYRLGFAWYDADKPEDFSSYKMPHQDVIDGKFKTVWRGVVAAMASLLGARGGVDIPDAERKSVYNHLAAHYRQFDEEPPKFSSYEPEELKALFAEVLEEKAVGDKGSCSGCAELKAGRVLSAKNRGKVKAAVKVLTELLELTEPDVDKQAAAEQNTKAVQSIQKILEGVIQRSKQISKS